MKVTVEITREDYMWRAVATARGCGMGESRSQYASVAAAQAISKVAARLDAPPTV